MGWNYRILAHKHNNDIYFQIHEVYYNDQGIPNGYTKNPCTIGSDNIDGIKFSLTKIVECTEKPILWAGENFPNEYEIKQIHKK
jgi:hypothetical protein